MCMRDIYYTHRLPARGWGHPASLVEGRARFRPLISGKRGIIRTTLGLQEKQAGTAMIARRAGHIALAFTAAMLLPLLSSAATPPTTPTPPTRFPCDRACLARHTDAFFTALAAHDPSRLPLSKDVKYTETGI